MVSQNGFVVKGMVIIFALLFFGVAQADETKVSATSDQVTAFPLEVPAPNFDFSYRSRERMEEVIVTAKRISAIPSGPVLMDFSPFKIDLELFPRYDSSNILDRSELLGLGDRLGPVRFTEVFRVRFGSKS